MEYTSNRQKKIKTRKALQLDTLFEKRKQEAEERWTNAQIKAAGFQSVLDYAVEQFNTHKDEIEEEMITERQKEIESFLMSEKDVYLAAMGVMAD
jgi:hypothetical protein